MSQCEHEWRRGTKQFPFAGGKHIAYEHICLKCGEAKYISPGCDLSTDDIQRRRARLPLPVEKRSGGALYCPACHDEIYDVSFQSQSPAPCSSEENPHAWVMSNGYLVAIANKFKEG